MALTPRSLDVLRALAAPGDYPPTVREVCANLGVSSPATVHRYITRLVGLGLVETQGKRRRITALGWSALRHEELAA